jgi:hypothetical protein
MAGPHATPHGGAGRPAVKRPDARPMRTVVGAGGLAAVSAIAVAIVVPPQPYAGPPVYVPPTPIAPGTPPIVQQPIRYVQLEPGQTAPPGAKVIDAGAPTPITVVTVVQPPAQKPVVVKTTQSGKVIP